MISASDVLQIITEIHQYSMLLLELKESDTLGILHTAGDRMTYFRLDGKLDSAERARLVKRIYAGQTVENVKPLTVEGFLRQIEGRKAKHIWLETGGGERKEYGFMTISELKSFFRSHSRL